MGKLWKLRIDNIKKEKELLLENKIEYNKMLSYLRGLDINIYHQEVIRQDIISMILDGQERDADMEVVFGKDLKNFMDEVLEAAPRMSGKEKVLDFIYGLLCISALVGLLFFLPYYLYIWLETGVEVTNVKLGLSNILSFIHIILVTHLLISNFTRNVFDSKKEFKLEVIIVIFFALGNLFIDQIVSKYDSRYFIGTTNINIILFFLISLVLALILKYYISRKYHKDII